VSLPKFRSRSKLRLRFVSPDSSFFHGGVRGLRKGSVLLPRSRTGVATTPYSDLPYSPDYVYITTSEDAARAWAALYVKLPARSRADIGGDLYEVESLAEIEDDPDHGGTPGLSHRTKLAKVTRVIERKVRLTEEEIDALMAKAIESIRTLPPGLA
jgi:hypothetical protein